MFINSNNQKVILKDPLYVLIVLDSLIEKKSLIYHDIILEHMSYFNQIHVPVYIVTPDTTSILYSISARYKSNIQYFTTPEFIYFKENNLIKYKTVYGKKYSVLYTDIKVISNDNIVYHACHINKNTMLKAYLKSLDIVYANFKKNIKKKLT